MTDLQLHLHAQAFTHGAASDELPHVDSCNFCQKCLADGDIQQQQQQQHRAARSLAAFAGQGRRLADSGIPGAVEGPQQVFEELIGPSDHEEKLLKPNCTVCRGCTTLLTDMYAEPVKVGGLEFMHGKGATNGWLMFGQPLGSEKRYIVRVRG